MPFLRQSTSQVIRFGPALDRTDGVTEEVALTLAQADMRLSKDGGAFAQKNAAGNATHDSDGWYSTTLDATDTSTVGELILNVHQPAEMLPIWKTWWVLEEVIYDALYGAGAAAFDASGQVSLVDDAITEAKIATDAFGALELATDAVDEIRDAIYQGILSEGYAADGSATTFEQILYMIWSTLHDFDISGVTITSKKLDGSDSMTHTLDDPANPTSRTRAT